MLKTSLMKNGKKRNPAQLAWMSTEIILLNKTFTSTQCKQLTAIDKDTA